MNSLNKDNIKKEFINLCVLFGCDYLDIRTEKSDLELYKLVKEEKIELILDNCNRKISLEKFNKISNIFNKVVDFKFDIIKSKKINSMKLSYLTKYDIELIESFLKNNDEIISEYKLNNLRKFCKILSPRSPFRNKPLVNFRPGFKCYNSESEFNNYSNYQFQ